MLTPSQRDRIDVVLVSPRNPLNIGAVARAMANFGLSHLTVVAPYEPHWREARSAIGAPELLQNAKQVESVAEAVASCAFVAGTGTLTYRRPEQPVIALPDLAPVVAQRLVFDRRIALVFGPEKHGLTREDLSYCHALVTIPTDPRQPSMNLGQAVAVCLYEIACRVPVESAEPSASHVPPCTTPSPSTSAALDRLADLIERTMLAAGYSPRAMQPANRHDLRLLLRRIAPSPLDMRRMLGLFRRILFRMHRSPDPRANRNDPHRADT